VVRFRGSIRVRRYIATHAVTRSRALEGPDTATVLDELVRSLSVDCLVFDPANVALLVERFGAGHLLYGTDHPFLPEGFDGPAGSSPTPSRPASVSTSGLSAPTR